MLETLFQKETSYPKCFVSYCWANSHEAVKKGTKSSDGSLGWGDPRDLKKHLEKNKIPCWMDIERIGQVLSRVLVYFELPDHALSLFLFY